MVRTVKKNLSVAGLAALTFLVLVAGCATGGADPNYTAYLKAATAKEQKPLVKIVAQPGKEITGLQSITVYAPGQGAAQLRPYQAPAPHPVWGVLGAVVRVAGAVGTIWAGGEAAKGLAQAVGAAAGHNTQVTNTGSQGAAGVGPATGGAWSTATFTQLGSAEE